MFILTFCSAIFNWFLSFPLLWPLWWRRKAPLQLAKAKTYEEWREIALELDSLHGHESWKKRPESKSYDWHLIQQRLKQLKSLPSDSSTREVIHFLRSILTRTKVVIEEYVKTVVEAIDQLSLNENIRIQEKLDFFRDGRQAFGGSALILQGGATFGLYHLGVVKTLNQHGVLPRIICGSAVGALIAALVCIRSDLGEFLNTPEGINLQAFASVGAKGTITRKLKRFLQHGYLMDVKVLETCVRANVGDITFEEAFKKTGRILNITVSTTRKFEVPQLLNYITAPNVLIWSAACASTAMMGLYECVELLAKDNSGNIVLWNQAPINWSECTESVETPLTRLSELFNVNHFIVSQANPILAPFIAPTAEARPCLSYIYSLITSEITHRLRQLDYLGLLPRFIKYFIEDRVSGNVTIVPSLTTHDFVELLSNPTSSSLQYWVEKGERSTWPWLSLLQVRCAIEQALDRGFVALHYGTDGFTPEHVSSVRAKRSKRTKSIH